MFFDLYKKLIMIPTKKHVLSLIERNASSLARSESRKGKRRMGDIAIRRRKYKRPGSFDASRCRLHSNSYETFAVHSREFGTNPVER